MHMTLASSVNSAIPFMVISIPFGITSLLFIPQQWRDRRLRKSGVHILAVCEERIRRGGTAVQNLNCSFRTDDDEVSWALVTAPKPVPWEGEEVAVVFDPRKPSSAESAYYLASFGSRAGLVIQALFCLLLVAAAVASILS